MVDIFLCGRTDDQALRRALLPSLAKYGSVRYFGNDEVLALGDSDPDFFVYDCNQLPRIGMEKGVILFKNSFQAKEDTIIPKGFLCVFESHNTQAAATLWGKDTAAVTCGTGPKETLTLASLDYDEAALSLQRSLHTLSGTLVEPHDFKVTLMGPIGPRQLLAVSAVLLVAGISTADGYTI